MANERKPMMAQQARKKREKTLGEKQYDTYIAELDSNFDKLKRISKEMKGASPNIQEKVSKKFKNFKDQFGTGKMAAASDRDTAKVQKMAKGGRAGLKGGGICKRGMNRKAVGKNS
jgi:hypothetical protein